MTIFDDYNFSMGTPEKFNANPFYNPEACGLTIVASIDLDDENYQFNYLVVWKSAEGDFYMATDSGCSCPTPFENHNTLSSLEKITGASSLDQIKATLRGGGAVSKESAQEFMENLRAAMVGR